MFPFRLAVGALFTLTCLLPAAGQADNVFLFKLGSAQLRDHTQELGSDRELDRASSTAYGAMYEHRFRRVGIGIGPEYTFYRHDYQSAGNPKGQAETRALVFSVRKYFLYDKPARPFVGLGFGGGRTEVMNGGPNPYDDTEYTTVLQAVAGVEFLIENLSLVLEVRHLQHDIEGGGDEYDPTATGVFAGVGLNW